MGKPKTSWRAEIQFWINSSPGEISETKITTIQESYKIDFVTVNSNRLIWHWEENLHRPFNVSSACMSSKSCNLNLIRGIVGLVGIVDDNKNLRGFLFVKKRNHVQISLPEDTLTSKQFNEMNYSYSLSLYKTIRNHFGIPSQFIWQIDLQNQIHKIAEWQYHTNYCLRSYMGTARIFYVTLNEKYLSRILSYRNQTIEEVLFVTKPWLESNPVIILENQLVSPTIRLTNGSVCKISPLHLVPTMQLCGMSIQELVQYLPVDEIHFD
jgi:hypothetical protein